MTLLYVVTGLLMGVVFGFALEKGRVFEPGVIVGQFQLRNFVMVKMFLSAIATTMLVFAILVGLGWADFHAKVMVLPAVILGGLVFGAGMALTGACPGTVLAQVGAGYRDAWMTVAGGVLGATAYGYLKPTLTAWNFSEKKWTVAELTGWPFWLLTLMAVILLATMVFALEKRKPWTEELGPNADGLLSQPEQNSQ